MDLLKNGVSGSEVVKAINKLGIDFAMTSDRERRFRRTGADDDVIDALNEASKGGEETITPAASTGSLEIHTQPGEAQVYLNDELKGMSSPEGKLRMSNLPPGTYTVRVSLPGYESWERSLTVNAGRTTDVQAPLVSKSPQNPTEITTPVTTTTTTTTGFNPSAIPLPDVKVDEVKFFESGGTVPDVGKRTYQTAFPSATTRYVYWELNLSWGKITSRVDFDLNADWYDPNGKSFGHNTHASHVEPDWNGGSVHADGWGCQTAPCTAWTSPGTYTVEISVKGVKVADGSFQVSRGTSPEIKPTLTTTATANNLSAIPLPSVSLVSLKLFESGRGTPDEDKRQYATVFSKASARYVNWELHLAFGSIPSRTDWDINTTWYGPDGAAFSRTVHHAHAMPDWNGASMHVDGWGCDSAPCSAWTKTGNYKIELFVRGVKIASATFQVE
jgi:PEGA domain-containing protein